MNDLVTLAVLGSGPMAAVHAAAIARDGRARVSIVAGGRGAAALAEEHGARAATVEQALEADDIDGVVIATPSSLHVEHLVAAVQCGKAALVEKPVDLDLAKVDACLAAVGDAASRVVVGFNRRFDPSISDAKHRAASGDIGDPTQLFIISRDFQRPPLAYLRHAGGLFRDMTIHDLDLARHFLGEIEVISAFGQSTDPELAQIHDHDGGVLILRSVAGGLATIVSGRRSAPGYDQRLEIAGSAGTIRVDNPAATTVTVSTAHSSRVRPPLARGYADRYADSYLRQMSHFIDVILDGVEPLASLADGREALALADAATRSARLGEAIRPN